MSNVNTNITEECVEKKNQLDVTECFIALMICSKCFGNFYAHLQELETIRVLLPPMVCSAWLLVVGGQVQGSRVCDQEEGCCTRVHVSGTSMPIIRSSRLHVCYCRLWCAVLGCWLSGVRCRAAGCATRKRDAARRAASL
jgi:hypothetical protein